MEEESAFKDAAKPSPSLTSLNRELSTVSFTYAQVVAIVGPANVHRLLSQGKVAALPSRAGDKGDKSKKLSESVSSISFDQIESPNLLQEASHGEIVNLGAALPDEIMMHAAKENEKLQPFGEGSKEIQGAADLCIRPSKIAAMQSDTELNIKYKALASGSQELAQSKDASAEGHESHESPQSTNGQRHAAGNSTSIRGFDDKNEFAVPSSQEHFEDNNSFTDDLFPETNSSLVTADNSSIHYPTAVTRSFSTDSFKLCQKSVDTVSDSWWTDEDIAPSLNSISTATLPSDCSEVPSNLFPAKGFSPDEVVTAKQHTDDLDTAETAESDIEATNRIFNIVLNAKSEQLNHVWGSEKGTSVTSDLVTGVSCLEDWK
uniref:Clathrin_bdg domain-containing protein n=1 Tax=Angiostrongylus cantonensis TaxID=6313 RepID=A0A0K0D0V9_ANGCA